MIRFIKQFKHFFLLMILLALSTFLIYYIPAEFNRLLFLLFFIPIWRSKKDFIWYAFLLILIDSPGGLFSAGRVNDPYRVPVYNFAPGISFAFEELYIIILLFKGIFKKKWLNYKSFVYRKQYKTLGFYLILLILLSLLLGVSFISMRNLYKTLIAISLYFSAVFIFSKEEDVIGFFKALFPFAFVAILLQMYGMAYHQQFVAIFRPGIISAQGSFHAGQLLRPIEFAVVLLCCFLGSFLYIDCKSSPFHQYYLVLVMITSYISIIMTATRTWFLGFSIMFILYFFINLKKAMRSFRFFVTGLGVFLLIMSLVPQIKNQVAQSWNRLETIGELAQSEITESSMKQRATVRAPRVMEGFNKSTILFGDGFSDLYYEYADYHVGFQNILLNSGIIGFILLLSFAMTLFVKPLKISKKADARSDLKSILLNLPLLVPAVLAINSGTQFWGYDIGGARVMLLAFYISISSVYINAQKHASYKKY